MTLAEDRFAIMETVDRYAVALDARDWALLDQVFTPDATGDFGQWQLPDREGIRAMIQDNLGGCGPTQHMLGVYRIAIAGNEATSVCSIRAHHLGVGAQAAVEYECFGEYRDRLVRTPDGWRIRHREMRLTHEIGDRSVLRPA